MKAWDHQIERVIEGAKRLGGIRVVGVAVDDAAKRDYFVERLRVAVDSPSWPRGITLRVVPLDGGGAVDLASPSHPRAFAVLDPTMSAFGVWVASLLVAIAVAFVVPALARERDRAKTALKASLAQTETCVASATRCLDGWERTTAGLEECADTLNRAVSLVDEVSCACWEPTTVRVRR